jgi:ammonium transporter, Amt family
MEVATMLGRILLLGFSVMIASPALAQPKVVADSGDNAWVLASTLLIMLTALPGLALFHGRGRIGPSGLSLFISMASTTLLFAMLGYSFAFGPGSTLIGGMTNGFLTNLASVAADTTISETVFAVFMMVVAVLTTSILTASIAERARFNWMLAFIPLWFLLVYIPLARWLAGGGWLAQLGTVDYAGGMLVHGSAGLAAFVIAMMLGAPISRSLAHDSRLAIAGISLAWIGIAALIAGSTMGASEDAGTALINAFVASASAALVGAIVERSRTGSSSFYGVATATVAGLAAISSGAIFVGAPGAFAIGIIASLASAFCASLMYRLSVGSAASSFVIHGVPGLIGSLVFPLFVAPQLGGPGLDESLSIIKLLTAQIVGVGIVAVWTIVVTAIAALIVSLVIPMREAEYR